jgi:hypothetical protein
MAFGQGLWHGYTDWLTTDDPRTFGSSFGTVVVTVAGPKVAAKTKALIGDYFGARPYPVLVRNLISGTTRASHRASANSALYSRLAWNPFLRWRMNGALGADVMEHMSGGKGGLRNPPGTEWHHPVDMPDHMELLERSVHRDPSLQGVLHPNGRGGFANNF